MKRLFALIGITYLSVLAVVFYFDNFYLLIATAAASLLCTVLFALLKISPYAKKTAIIACVAAFAACTANFCYTQFYYNPIVENYSNQELKVNAVLCEEARKSYGNYIYQLETEQVNGEEESFKINLISYKELKVDVYDKIECNLTAYQTGTGYYKSKAVFLAAYTDDDFSYSVSENEDKPLYYYAVRIRTAMKTALNTLLPSELSSLCSAVLLGDKFALTQGVRSDFSDTGVTFLIVVSGMHLAIISSFVLFLVKKITKNRIIRSAFLALTVFAFAAVTGFAPSVMRAGIMILITFCGKIIFRHGDSLNSLGVAALALTILNPYAVGDIGMLLSFSATMGIVLWSKGIFNAITEKLKNVRHFRKILFSVIELFSVSLSATLWVIPFSILYFGRLSPYCVIVSMLTSPFISILIICALLAAVFFYCGIFSFLAYPFALVAGLSGKYILFVVGLFAKIPYCSINAEKPYFYVWLFVSVALVIAGVFLKRKGRYVKYSTAFSFFVLLAGYIVYTIISLNTTCLNVCNTGDGLNASVSRGENLSVICCGGEKRRASDAVDSVERHCLHIDYIIIPSRNNYYDRYLGTLQNEFDADSILLYDNEGETQLYQTPDGTAVKTFCDDTRFALNLNSNTYDRVISVNGHTYQYISSGLKTVLVMPYNGDALELPENYRSADYLLINDLPQNCSLLSVENVIVSCSEDTFEEINEELTKIFKNIITVDESLDITIG